MYWVCRCQFNRNERTYSSSGCKPYGEQKTVTDKGGTMRLEHGNATSKSLAYKIYGKETISERHRHRYEYNNSYVEQLQKQDCLLLG
jgi:CTP synthase